MATIEQDRNASQKPTVTVVYNGRSAPVVYQPQQAFRALLAHALGAFGIAANRDDMALFNAAGAELAAHASVGEAGVAPGDQLLLRQRVVRGG